MPDLPEQLATAAAAAAADALSKVHVVKLKRERYYGAGEAADNLTVAVGEWLEKKGRCEKEMSLKRFCQIADVRHETFRKYVCKDVGKRRVLGSVTCGRSVAHRDTEQFVVDTLRRKERGDDGKGRSYAIDMIQDFNPKLSRKQCTRMFDKRIRPQHKDELTGIIKPQASVR